MQFNRTMKARWFGNHVSERYADADLCPSFAEPVFAVQPRRAARQTPLYALHNVSVRYRSPDGAVLTVLDRVNADLPAGFTGIIGPSGSGKTTLLHVLAGLIIPDEGGLNHRGEPVPRAGAALRRYQAEDVALVLQEGVLFGHQTALGNVRTPLLLRGLSRRRANAAAREMLELMNIGDRARHRPAELSRGQCMRVAIAMGLVTRPNVILMDEPTGALDPENGERIMETCCQLARQNGLSIVMVTHNVALAARFCDELFVCSGGKVIRDVNPDVAPVRPALSVVHRS